MAARTAQQPHPPLAAGCRRHHGLCNVTMGQLAEQPGGRHDDRPTQASGEAAARAPPAVTAEAPRPATLAAIEDQSPQTAAFVAATTAARQK